MKNFIKGALALWTVLTTIWTFITFDLIGGIIEGFGERDDRIQKTRRPVSHVSYHDETI